jgi:signal transduction histidine kinase/ligand-binding sensor domain-containing protein
LRNFNTFREAMLRRCSAIVWVFATAAFLCLARQAGALDASQPVSQSVYDKWGAANGFTFGEIFAVSQSDDGYLWIGTEQGLVRFDGSSFRLFDRPIAGEPALGAVLGLVQDGDGTLWIRAEGPVLLRYRSGRFEDAFAPADVDEFAVTAMLPIPGKGMLLWARGKRGYCYCGRKMEIVSDPAQSPGTVIALTQTRDQNVWAGTSEGGLFRLGEGHFSSAAPQLAETKVNALAPSVSGGLWVGTDQGILFWDGARVTRGSLPDWIEHLQILALREDGMGNLWAGTDRGLLRIGPMGSVSQEMLSSNGRHGVNAIFIDREGELWFGGANGLERLHNGLFRSWWTAQGLPAEIDGPIYAGADGRTWFAPRSGGLYWMRDGRVERVTAAGLEHDVVYSIAGGDGEIWAGRQRGGLTRLTLNGDSISAHTFTTADGLAQNSVYSLLRTHDGTVWAGTVSGGISRFKNGAFINYTVTDGLPADAVNSLAESRDGTIWAATPNGLASFTGKRWVSSPVTEQLPSAEVTSIFADSQDVLWIATARGLAFLAAGKAGVLHNTPEPLRDQILGMSEDRQGHLWFVTSGQILRVGREELLSGQVAESEVRSYGSEDGLRPVEGVNRDRSMVMDNQGRLWISLTHGIAMADPRLTDSSLDPLDVRIESISAAGRSWAPESELAGIPSGTRSVAFSFATTSFEHPEHVLFRYKLDGSDQDWSTAVDSRQVTYRNLGPGSYRFHVAASNGDGLWNSPETSVSFFIERAFWETWWFRALCFSALLLAIFGIYRVRMYQVARQLNARFQERLAERTRIAQELHDTLLQGFLSASMQVDMAEDQIPESSPAKPLLKRALQLMSQVTEEGRNALRGLRTPEHDKHSLEVALSRVGQELMVDDGTEYRVVTHNTTRVLRPSIREAVYRIGREAIVNTFKHARATHVEVEVEYEGNRFRLLVRDDGRGIDPEVLQTGRENHWGLPGMRERAESIGGTLKLRSRSGAGTEVELTVPGPIAFDNHHQPGSQRWRSRLGFGKREETTREKTTQKNGNGRPE